MKFKPIEEIKKKINFNKVSEALDNLPNILDVIEIDLTPIELIIKASKISNMTEAVGALPGLLEVLQEKKSELELDLEFTDFELECLWHFGASTAKKEENLQSSAEITVTSFRPDLKFSRIFQNAGEVAFSLGYIRQKFITNKLPLKALEKADEMKVKYFKAEIINTKYSSEFKRHIALVNGWRVQVVGQYGLICYDFLNHQVNPVFESDPLVGNNCKLFERSSPVILGKKQLKLTDEYIRKVMNEECSDSKLYYDEEFGIIRYDLSNSNFNKTPPPLEKFFNELRGTNKISSFFKNNASNMPLFFN